MNKHQIRYKVIIKYIDFDNQMYEVPYELFALDGTQAVEVAKELFFMEFGTFEDMFYDTELVLPGIKEQNHVNKQLKSAIGVVRERLSNLTYKKFLEAYRTYDGFNLLIKPNFASFNFNFKGFRCTAVFENGESKLSGDELIYYSESYNRFYSIRDNLTTILISTN